jgi:tetratricopeptide (TPR) repeat protein
MAPRSLFFPSAILPVLLFAFEALAEPTCPDGSGCAPQFNEKIKPYSRPPQSPAAQAARRLSTSIEEAQALYDRRDRDGAGRILDGVMRDPGFETLPAKDRRLAWAVLARIDMSAQRYDRAVERLARANAADDSDPDIWYWLAMVEDARGKPEAAARAFTELAERWPELLANIEPREVYRLQSRLGEGSQAKVDFLQTLFDAKWDDSTGDASALWHLLALLRLERGEPQAARTAMRRIVHPDLVASMRSDRRFDAVVDRDAWAFNVEHAATRAVEAMREKTEARPNDLDVKVQLSYALLDAGDHEGLMRLVDAVLASSADPGREAAGGQAERTPAQHAWLLNNRAVALYRLGRTQEAIADMERARRLPTGGGPNVSQTLNLGEFHCTLGRAADTKRMADAVDGGQVSDYGRMFQARLRLCAAWLSQDARGMKRAFAAIRKGRARSEEIHLDALVMLGRLDEAAQALIALLDAPRERADILQTLQRYREVAPSPTLARLRAQRDALLARDDVKAAIDRVGRRERYDLYFGAGFD